MMFLNCAVGEDYWESPSNQSILKETSPEYSLEGLMLKLKLQYFDHPIWRTDSLEKILMLGKIEGSKRRGQQRMRWLHGIIDSMDMSLNKPWDLVQDREAWCAVCSPWGRKESDMTEWLYGTELIMIFDLSTWPKLVNVFGLDFPRGKIKYYSFDLIAIKIFWCIFPECYWALCTCIVIIKL